MTRANSTRELDQTRVDLDPSMKRTGKHQNSLGNKDWDGLRADWPMGHRGELAEMQALLEE